MTAGEITAYAADHIILHGLVRTSVSGPQFALIGELLSYEPFGFLLPGGDPDFRLFINRRLAKVFRTKNQEARPQVVCTFGGTDSKLIACGICYSGLSRKMIRPRGREDEIYLQEVCH